MPQTAEVDWKEQHAYTLGVQAYVYLYPWIYLNELRYEWVGRAKPDGWTEVDMPFNGFWNKTTLVDANYRDGGSPNNDTQYSVAILDLRNGPVVISHPDLEDRYFTFEIASMTSDNFAYIGTRTTGNEAGSFLVAGPNWNGEIPEGLEMPAKSNGVESMNLPAISPTPFAIVFGRTAVEDISELETVNSILAQYEIIPLENWLSGESFEANDRDTWQPFDRTSDELADWKTINRGLEENPPLAQNMAAFELFKSIGIGPGIDVDSLDENLKRGLARAAIDGRKLVVDAAQGGLFNKRVNGWSFPASTMGSAGYYDDLLTRAVLQCSAGIISNDPEEATYPNTFIDIDGDFLDGGSNYIIRFNIENLPEVSQFWSLTLYDETYNFVDNPINRYNLSSLRDDLSLNDDGELILYIQNESPGENKSDYWLPSPKTGRFFLVLRAYGPGQEILDQTWIIPGVEENM